jgi:raffinose/stachyose/melibiose transport system substrate-binding protein
MFKKGLAILLCISFMITVLVACQGNTGTTTTQATTVQTTASSEPVTLSLLSFRSDDAAFYDKINKTYEDRNPGVKINVQLTSTDASEYTAVLKARLLSGENCDLFNMWVGAYLIEYASSGSLAEIPNTDLLKNFSDSILEAGRYNSKLYGIPVAVNCTPIIYNKKIFSQFGLEPPKTWSELLNIIDTLNANGISPIATGLADSFVTEWYIDNIMAGLATDTKMFAKIKTGEVKLTDKIFIDSYKALAELAKHNAFQKNALGTKYEASLSLFSQEKAAMVDTGDWSLSTFKADNPDMDLGFFNMPAPNDKAVMSITPSYMWCMSAKSKYQEQSLKYIDYFYSNEVMSIYANEFNFNVSRIDVKVTDKEVSALRDMINSSVTIPFLRMYSPSGQLDDGIIPDIAIKVITGEDVTQACGEGQVALEKLLSEQ